MKLLDIIEVCDENKKTYVQDANEDYVTSYDGKNSIDPIYNDCEVVKIEGWDDDILITIIK